MKFGFVLPYGDATVAAEFAHEAERAGWDGFFVWEPVYGYDAWVMLTAAAIRTERIKLGTLISPLSRMRPWQVAMQALTLDRLSGGRVILSVGLGATDTGFAKFGEVVDRKIRAELVDESLDILFGLWGDKSFTYAGKHYQINEDELFSYPEPAVQQPRIPVWMVGAWGYEKSMARVLKCDGLLPALLDANKQHTTITPDHIQAMRGYLDQHGTYDLIMEGETPTGNTAAANTIAQKWANAGATWWIENRWNAPRTAEGLQVSLDRIRQGPPQL
jgi:hypothetical protein